MSNLSLLRVGGAWAIVPTTVTLLSVITLSHYWIHSLISMAGGGMDRWMGSPIQSPLLGSDSKLHSSGERWPESSFSGAFPSRLQTEAKLGVGENGV